MSFAWSPTVWTYATQMEVFALVVQDVKARNADADPAELEKRIEEAVERARAARP